MSASLNLFRRSTIQVVLILGLIFVVCFNRSVTKLGIGPIYFYDALFVLGICLYWRYLFAPSKPVAIYLLILMLCLSWLVVEYSSNQISMNGLRRSAMAVYLLTPLLLIAIVKDCGCVRLRYRYVALAVGAIAWINLENYSATIAAQFLGVALAYAIIFDKDWRILLILAGGFFSVSLGMTSDGDSYRTPLFAFGVAIACLLSGNLADFLFHKKAVRRISVHITHLAIVVLAASMLFKPVQNVSGQMLSAVAGLVGSESLKSLGQELSPGSDRERGDAAGTGETRTKFWRGIIDYSLLEKKRALIGNGHYLGFFERIFPNDPFINTDVLEPHNSFIGFYYRYGLLGIFLLFAFITQIYQVQSKLTGLKARHLLPAAFASIIYASFEVALEGPHGAVAFWVIFLYPLILFGQRKSS